MSILIKYDQLDVAPVITRLFAVSMAILISSSIQAAGQTNFNNPKETIDLQFWGTLYNKGGHSLFCDKKFKRKTSRIIPGYVYTSSWIRDHLDCGASIQCSKNNEQYGYMLSDLHNMYPVMTRVELSRRNSLFGNLDGLQPDNKKCDIKTSFQTIEPRDEVKGNIARAMLYMHTAYNLPLMGTIEMYKGWNSLDPIDDAEKQRNELIKQQQGNGNPYIENPALIDDLR